MKTHALINTTSMAAAIVFAGITVNAASIGMQFLGWCWDKDTNYNATPEWALAPDMEAGVIPQKNWNNIPCYLNQPNWGLVEGLRDDSGQFTQVGFLYQSNDGYFTESRPDTPNGTLMRGIIKASFSGFGWDYADPASDIPSGSMHLTVTNLPAGTYDVYVYLAENNRPAEGHLTVGSTTFYVQEIGPFSGTFEAATSTDSNAPDATANYCVWKDVPADSSGKILVEVVKTDKVVDGFGVSAVQIVKKTGGNFAVNNISPLITQQPVDTVGVVGGVARFLIGIDGPWAVQWRINGLPIVGANKRIFMPSPLSMADSGTVDVVVSNNIGQVISMPATLTVDPKSDPVLTQGALTVRQFRNISGPSPLQTLFDDPRFPNAPDVIYPTAGSGADVTLPEVYGFGAIVIGWVKPPVTSDYTFFLNTPTYSAFYINTNAAISGTNAIPIPGSEAPGSKEPICEQGNWGWWTFLEPDPNQGGGWNPGPLAGLGQTTLIPIHLEAGKLYGICLAYCDDGYIDFAQFTWRRAGDTTPSWSLPLVDPYVWSMTSHAGYRISITQQPQNVTVGLGDRATFSVNAQRIPIQHVFQNDFAVQWMRNGEDIVDATGSSYTTPPLQLTDKGAKFSARIISLAGATNSVEATVTIAPKLSISRSGDNITIGWSGATGTLEFTTELKSANTVWTPIGTQNPATISIVAGQNRYYRVKE